MDFATAQQRARILFQGIKALDETQIQDLAVLHFDRSAGPFASRTPKGFSIPALVQYAFSELLGIPCYGPYEKVRWGLAFEYAGVQFAFRYQKFGLRCYCDSNLHSSAEVRGILGRARGLVNVAEQHIANDLADKQIRAGNVTIRNLFVPLHTRYMYLREVAVEQYRTPPKPPVVETWEHGTSVRSFDHEPRQKGGALAGAAVDAYFSRTEHLFALAIPFVSSTPPDVLVFLGSNWSTKARAILPIETCGLAKRLYDEAIQIRNEWRNPLAHGGFLTGGRSLYVHVPGVGALPAQLTKTPNGARVAFSMHESNFEEVGRHMDEMDEFLRTGELRFAYRWAMEGLDVSLSPSSIQWIRQFTTNEEDFERLIELTHYEIDMHTNMDY